MAFASWRTLRPWGAAIARSANARTVPGSWRSEVSWVLLSIQHVLVTDNTRTGVLYVSSTGGLTQGTITRNAIGQF